MVEAAARSEDAPGVALCLDEGQRALHECSEVAGARGGSVEAVTDPRLEAADDGHVDGIDETTTITQVAVNQRSRDAPGLGDLVEGEQERVVLGEEVFGRIDDQSPPGLGVKACGPWPPHGWRGHIAQAMAPLMATGVGVSSGKRGWWQAT